MRLERAELAGAAVDAALDELCATGYLDDARYARLFIEDKRELERWGRDRISRTLLERGVAREIVEVAMGATTPADELERAVALIERRFPEPPEDLRERERALGMLLRKGYDSDTAYEAVRACLRRARRAA